MFAAAHDAAVDPDRVSFVAALRITRRSLSQARDFPPQGTDHGWTRALILLCRRLNPIRRLRSNPRVIKRKMPKWHVNETATPTGHNPPAHPSHSSSGSN